MGPTRILALWLLGTGSSSAAGILALLLLPSSGRPTGAPSCTGGASAAAPGPWLGGGGAAEAGLPSCPRQKAVSLLQHEARWGRTSQGAPERRGADAETHSERTLAKALEGHSDARPGKRLCERDFLRTMLLQAWGAPGDRGASALLDRGVCGGGGAALLQLGPQGASTALVAGFVVVLLCGLAAIFCCLRSGWLGKDSALEGCDQPRGTVPSADGPVQPVRWPSPERRGSPIQDTQGSPHPSPALLGRTRRPAAQDKLKPVVQVAFEDGQTAAVSGEMDGRRGVAAHVFCPGLVVPEGNECELYVPVAAAGMSFAITSPEGQDVLEVRPAPLAPGRRGDGSFVLLESGREVARCVAADGEFRLLTAAGDHYAFLAEARRKTPVGDRYFLLTTKTGVHWEFTGSFGDHAVDVMAIKTGTVGFEARSEVANTELYRVDQEGGCDWYRVRIGPGSDVGLALCGLLCVDHLAEQ